MKQLLLPVQAIRVFLRPKGQRDNHLPAQSHQFPDHFCLNRRKSGKSVKYHHAPGQESGLVQRTPQHIQRLLGGNKVSPDIFHKSLIQSLQIPKLLDQGSTLLRIGDQL